MPLNPPTTLTRTSHALTIRANGVTIGLLNGWNPAQSRTITGIYEINTLTSGDPLEKAPGNVTGLTIGIQRYDVYTLRMEEAFGTNDLMMLSLQKAPFQVQEKWVFPNNTVEVITYTGCWFSNIGRTYRSDGDRIVNVNATLEYVARKPVQT